MLIEWSIAGSAGAFICLAFYVVRTLRKGMVTLKEINYTLLEVRIAIHGLTKEAEKLIDNASQVTADVKSKINTKDSCEVKNSFKEAAGGHRTDGKPRMITYSSSKRMPKIKVK
ncbi:hypothetical protein BTO30_07010 [Domibacillus antri]|uniref:DUF948 domain-containing protein n=1 Tax=Domibacillus antri TaxID=1714264 RepID=A0A1Q8Q6G0_9BACI|nr:DUF948 domain-containing protein [Domibacillus antri]OLN22938.1 hypothetical protein BTO30_07010 [Domibacillus antri]